MYSKQKDKLLNIKDYIFLTICLLLSFIGGSYFLTGGNIPKDVKFYYIWGTLVIISIPLIIYILKKLTD